VRPAAAAGARLSAVTVSGLAGEGLDRLMESAFKVGGGLEPPGLDLALNRWLEGALSAHPPPAVSGRRIKIRYMTQPKSRPPYFALFGNQLVALPDAYKRYLVNGCARRSTCRACRSAASALCRR
jgi:GTP-binding protein